MNECTCDVCILLRWLDEQLEGRFDRAASALVQALWRVIAEAESQDLAGFHQDLAAMGMDLQSYQLLRTAAKLTSWELETEADVGEDPDDGGQTFLH